MKAKTKTKKSVGKLGRLKYPAKKESPINNDEGEDLSLLRKPIDTSLTSLRQIVKLFDNGSDEVKSILDYECDIIYECRICRSLTRSFASFLSHKRVYCQQKYDVTFYKDAHNHSSINPYKSKECSPSVVDQDTKENYKTKNQVTKEPCKKDLTSVVEMLQKKRKEDEEINNKPIRIISDNEQVLLEVMHKNNVAYQSVIEPENTKIEENDLMKAQTSEIQNILECDTAVLGPDGHLIEINTFEKITRPKPIFTKKDDDKTTALNTSLTCSLCNSKFSTKKTLTFHMKSLHTPHRMVYPCPLCSTLFTNPWGVYRHLFKIHRKTNEQVRKMRDQIQEKAYKTSTTRAQDIEKYCANEKLNNSLTNGYFKKNETEEWMAHLESDGDFQQCGGCGKKFDRKAALLSHSQICQKRIAARTDARASRQRQKMAAEINIDSSTTSTTAATATVPSITSSSSSSTLVNNNSISVKDIINTILPPKVKSPTFIDKDDLRSLPNIANISSSVTITRLKQEPVYETSTRTIDGNDTWDKNNYNTKKFNDNSKDDLAIISIKKEIKKEDVTIAPIDIKLNNVKQEDSIIISPINTNLNNDIKKEDSHCDDDPQVLYTNIDQINKNNSTVVSGSRKRKLRKNKIASSTPNCDKRCAKIVSVNNTSDDRPTTPITPDNDAPVSDRVTAIERRIATIADLDKLLCLLCDTKFTNMVHLRRHMVIHINWNRYRCNLCDFVCFDKSDAVGHCNKKHQAKNNKTIIDSIIEEIQPDNDVTDSTKNNQQNGDNNDDKIKAKAVDESIVPTNEHVSSTDEIQHIKNGETKRHSISDDEYNGFSDQEINEISSRSKKSKLDEDPELRRMVMEVIFGPASTTATATTTTTTTLLDDTQTSPSKSIDDNDNSTSTSSSSSPVLMIDDSCSNNDSPKSNESIKCQDDRLRPSRNRSKPIKKDFIYDIDNALRYRKTNDKLLSNNDLTNDNNSIDILNFNKTNLNNSIFNDKNNKLPDIIVGNK
ncbi:putative uncharacterized protein DDB_G0281251 [Aphidius gifuensis]|uniref:putative uncharacterized protein DDB_G0281251 n=1 Tax=Aphidius gifuensis TaxID=684658 RepID=UPI001CDCBD73|nr:putative uncharacterized protein DDB_G0281251 [Aphidius gifuensis]